MTQRDESDSLVRDLAEEYHEVHGALVALIQAASPEAIALAVRRLEGDADRSEAAGRDRLAGEIRRGAERINKLAGSVRR